VTNTIYMIKIGL